MIRRTYGDSSSRQSGFRFWRHCCCPNNTSSVSAGVSLAAAAAVFLLSTSARTQHQALAFLTTTIPHHSSTSAAAVSPCSSSPSSAARPPSPFRGRRVRRVFRGGAVVDMAHPCATTAAAAEEAEATNPPALVSGASDVETFFGRYRVRARRELDMVAVGGITEDMVEFSLVGKEEEEEEEEDIEGGSDDKQRQHRKTTTTTASEVWTVKDNSVLILEDLTASNGGGLVGFCGAIDPKLVSPAAAAAAATAPAATTTTTTTNPTLDTHIFIRRGCEIDASTASLLVRSLHGWLAGPAAAAAAAKQITARRAATARNRGAGVAAGAGGAGRQQEEEEEEVGGEMVDWVDTKGRVICALPRPMVHSNNILHRGAGVMIRNSEGEVYCHRRTSTKRVFPSMYDMFIGGVSGTLEPSLMTAARELGEELGLGPYGDGGSTEERAEEEEDEEGLTAMPASMSYRGECLVQTGHNRCVVSVFDYLVAPGETVTWQEEEVDWGSYLPWEEVVSKVSEGDWEFVPDGLQVWHHYLQWEAAAAAAAAAATAATTTARTTA